MRDEKQIIVRPIAALNPAQRNPRTHSDKQLRKIATSIERFGFISPLLIHGDPPRIVAGHGRWEAAKLLGLSEVPTLKIDHLTAAEARAYALADNQLATLAGWDRKLLSLEIAEIELALPELDISTTGFELEAIEVLRDTAASQCSPLTSPSIEIPRGPAVTQLDDLWLIGEHRLLCGDAQNQGSYERLLETDRADVAIVDLPYNVPINGHVTGQAHREFAMASGEMSRAEFRRFLSDICRQLAQHTKSGSLHYLFMDWRSISDLIGAGEQHFSELLNIIVWAKPQGGMGSFYRSRHELIALFRNGNRPHVNNIELGANGRNRTNVWEYAGVNGFGSDRSLGKLHPTVKNIDMIADAIRDCSRAQDLVLDPFGGSGTTLIAAHRTNRRARLVELDPLFCDLTIQRALAEGLSVTLSHDGESFAAIKELRAVLPVNAGEGR